MTPINVLYLFCNKNERPILLIANKPLPNVNAAINININVKYTEVLSDLIEYLIAKKVNNEVVI